MRVFLLACFLATSLAAPQGYSYQQQQQNSFGISHSTSSINSNGIQQGLSFQQQSFPRPQPPIIPPSFGITPQIHSQPQSQPAFQQHQQQQQFQQNYQPTPVVTKDIYVHVAPEEPEERFVQQPIPVAPPRKHYRIVFIKAPTPKYSSSAALRLQQPQNEEKTIIYVLTKKPDPLDIETALQEAAPKPPSKPEVYFIKYKTQEEAQHAQRTIQAQYDKLGGTTQISDEGVAPVTSVIGALDQQQSISSGSGFSTGGSNFNVGGVSSSYGAPLSTGNGSGGVSNSVISNANKYLPPIRI